MEIANLSISPNRMMTFQSMTDTMKSAILAFCLLAISCANAAGAEMTAGKRDCLVIQSHPAPKETAKWNGPCKDGYADGAGTLEWFSEGELTLHFEGSLKRGRMHGEGYTRDTKITQYEGGFVDGKRHGKGILLEVDLARYEGEWNDGWQDGTGSMTYSTGGRYEGQWKAGKFHGMGKATYTSGKVVEGEFRDGVPAGQSAIKTVQPDTQYGLSRDVSEPKIGFSTRVLGPMPNKNVTDPVPFRKRWEALSKDEQRLLRQNIPMLHEEDEPPYPVDGTAKLFRQIFQGQSHILTTGWLRMNVLVDSTGAPSTVTVFASPDPITTKAATFVVMKEKYKPALCAGIPCPMVFPFSIRFSVE
jgi:hypothetical protein